jgi:hypothetical protein
MKTIHIPFDMFEAIELNIHSTSILDDYVTKVRDVGFFSDILGEGVTVFGRAEKGYEIDIVLFKGTDCKHAQLLSYLSHEITHACQCITEYLGIKDDEFSAYLHQYILKVCLEKKVV